MDGVIDLEVSNPTKTGGDDAVEDGMGTSIALVQEGCVAEGVPTDVSPDFVSS